MSSETTLHVKFADIVTKPSNEQHYASQPTRTSYREYPPTPQETVSDQSFSNDSEQVVDISPNERYGRLNTILGKGAYKVVYKGIDLEEGYEVAWNTMQAIPDKDLEHEIEILKSVRHPNIIAFHDAWYNDSNFFFITELMTSGTVREYIRKLTPLPNNKIIKRWSRQILKGLAYLHNHHPPIIHRDIKCDNIFINGAHGEVKIGDMGTAEMKLGKKYTVIGTPEFMAPEMYDEEGYNEKVDIYAFGMCLLEMATGEYPYNECQNAAQIYKKVTAGIKPASLAKVQNPEVLQLIESCIGKEEDRMSAQQILEDAYLAVEPDVILLATDPDKVQLTLQIVFKGTDKLSVKFDFNKDNDTAEEVVREMIVENVLPDRYQQHITKEINRTLRDLDKPEESAEQVRLSVWRRESDIRNELARTREQLTHATDRVLETEQKCDEWETRARAAELKYKEAMKQLEEVGHNTQEEHEKLVNHILNEYADDTDIGVFVADCAQASHRGADKANEWAEKLKNQDIMTVGDLRDLHDEDWAGIGLTVFALRALKNMLKGKKLASTTTSPQPSSQSPPYAS